MINLLINGAEHQVEVPEEMPLLWVLRDYLEFTGTKFGFCQPGQLVNALALLENTDDPTDADIDKTMSGNICRCGTYVRIRAAIKRAAELSKNES